MAEGVLDEALGCIEAVDQPPSKAAGNCKVPDWDLQLHEDLRRLRDIFGHDAVGSDRSRDPRSPEADEQWKLAVSTLCGNLPQPGREAGYRLRTQVGPGATRVPLSKGDTKRRRRRAAELLIRKLDEAAHIIALHVGHVDKRVRALLHDPEVMGEDGVALPVVVEYSSSDDSEDGFGPPPPAVRPQGEEEEADRPPEWADAPAIASSAGSLSAEARTRAETLERARRLANTNTRRVASQMGRVALARWKSRSHRGEPPLPSPPPLPPSLPPAPPGLPEAADGAVDESVFLCDLRPPGLAEEEEAEEDAAMQAAAAEAEEEAALLAAADAVDAAAAAELESDDPDLATIRNMLAGMGVPVSTAVLRDLGQLDEMDKALLISEPSYLQMQVEMMMCEAAAGDRTSQVEAAGDAASAAGEEGADAASDPGDEEAAAIWDAMIENELESDQSPGSRYGPPWVRDELEIDMATHGSSASEVVGMRHVAAAAADAAALGETAVAESETLASESPSASDGPRLEWLEPGAETDIRGAAHQAHSWMVAAGMARDVGHARRRWQLAGVESEGDLVPAAEYAASLSGGVNRDTSTRSGMGAR